jgi:hypothetical protein
MHGQRGVTLSGFLVWAVLGIVVLLLGFKVGPAYFEYLSIQKQFQAIANDPAMRAGSRREIEGAFVGRATIENIRSIGPSDLEISKDGDRIVISASYSVRVPLFGNASACLDFHPTSAK